MLNIIFLIGRILLHKNSYKNQLRTYHYIQYLQLAILKYNVLELKWFNLFNLRQCYEKDSKVTRHLYNIYNIIIMYNVIVH